MNKKIIAAIPNGYVDAKRSAPIDSLLRTLPLAVPEIFFDESGEIIPINFVKTDQAMTIKSAEVVATKFPNLQTEALEGEKAQTANITGKKVGVIFSGGPASGGNNVLGGLFKVLKGNTLYGLTNGPDGLIKGNAFKVTADNMELLLNTGGFDFLGTGRTKIDKPEKFESVKNTVKKLGLDGIVVVGGDDSNTNAAELAEYLTGEYKKGNLNKGCTVIGVPKTIDGDLQINDKGNSLLPISFGFYTAARVMAKLVGNLLTDRASQKKYWFFVKLMGRSASHLTLEVALQTRPHITLISEEIGKKKMSMDDVVSYMSNIIAGRMAKEKNYGVAIIPEGVIEFIPEVKKLISELNKLSGKHVEIKNILLGKKLINKKEETDWNEFGKINALSADMKILTTVLKEAVPELKDYRDEDIEFFLEQATMTIAEKKNFICTSPEISSNSADLFRTFPDDIVDAMLLDRDDHGNLKVSQIPTEKLLMKLVLKKIKDMQAQPEKYDLANMLGFSEKEMKKFIDSKFDPQDKFVGYETRCGAPARFDANYSFILGLTAGSLVLNSHTGYMASVTDLLSGGKPLGIPLSSLIHTEVRKGKETSVIEKALVDLDSPAFNIFAQNRETWADGNSSRSPGSIQHEGQVAYKIPYTVGLNQGLLTWAQIDNGAEPDFNMGRLTRIKFD
ncbi:MAG: 6-phosphofructokinase [Candidatus Margulisbacteria bacterium]|nr:6-phosphofructokinase [Candidatus Margulisiibacteriota bacterium]